MSEVKASSKLQTVAILILIVGAILALGTSLTLKGTLWLFGNINNLGDNLVFSVTEVLGTVLFPWLTIFTALAALVYKKSLAVVASAATLLGLTIQLLGTLFSTITQSGYMRWEFRQQILGVYTFESIGLNDWIDGLVAKFGVYAAMAASIVLLVLAIRSRAPRLPMATPGFTPAAPAAPVAPATPAAQNIIGYDTTTGAPIYGDGK